MSNLAIFAEYAAAFEETLRDDNWARLEKYFAPDACYLPGDGTEGVGRDAALAALRRSVDLLERKTDSRELVGEPNIEEEGDRITLTYTLKYTKAGMDDLTLAGIELIDYEAGSIRRMEDIFDNAEQLLAWRAKL